MLRKSILNLIYDKRERTLINFTLFHTLFILITVALPFAILNFVGKPFQRGFFCDDESLMHPYKSNTIPTWLAIVVATSIPTVLVVVIEIKRQKDRSRIQLLSHQKLYRSLYRILVSLLFGFAANQLCTDIGKYSIGRLRPHFLTLCKPSINCTSNMGYIELDVCTSADKAALREAR
ncbi:hypothetical protein FSP39_023571 [Pinctada imbricata]|uniref:Phosphatidic acid phosphatase type 2/haloperoxidase domain-containing protein n=1 Tax=Pinctada imbricata TaxID=66713 RepID=A0AA89C2G3_PINIB|nr:hypothetical protein FSP39_023571 [Pinctada imbricata]